MRSQVNIRPMCAVQDSFKHWTAARRRIDYPIRECPVRRKATGGSFGVGERDSTPLHAKGGLEEFGRLVGDTAQSAGAMQVNHRGVAADAGFCRSAPCALRVSFASKSIHAVLAQRAYGT